MGVTGLNRGWTSRVVRLRRSTLNGPRHVRNRFPGGGDPARARLRGGLAGATGTVLAALALAVPMATHTDGLFPPAADCDHS